MEAKTAVLAASLVAGLAGYFALRHEAKLEELPSPTPWEMLTALD